MSRFGRLCLAVLMSIAAIAMLAQIVLAGPLVPGNGEMRRLPPPPTPPPLPFSVGPTSQPGSVPNADAVARRQVTTIRLATGLRRPAPMDLHKALALLGARRHVQSASGGTIVLTGDSTIYQVYDATLSYNNFNYIQCAGLKPNTSYNYLIFPPDGSSWSGYAGPTDNNGTCQYYFPMYFGTPFNPSPAPGTDAPYSGVWAIAVQNQNTGQYESVVYLVVLASQHFQTYADGALLHPTTDFQAGSTVYVNATGLNPSHNYGIGWVYTGAPNLPCVYSVPTSGNTQPGTCFVSGSTAGTAVPTGQLTVGWPVGSTPATGTYTVELYDATANDLVGTQQISIEPSTLAWTLTPYNTSAGTGTNVNDTFANDGYIDASVTGLTYQVSGLPSGSNGHTVALAVSDPNGMVFNPGSNAFNPGGTAATATQSGGAVAYSQIAFPANATLLQALGPTVTPFAPNVLTAQLYDRTSGTVLGSKSFTILGYQGALAWTNPATNILATPVAGTTAQVTVSNTAGSAFGSWNADGISGVKLSNDGAGELLSLPGGNTTATDTAGNVWDVTYVGGTGTVISVTPDPANPTATLNGTTTLSFNVTVSLTSGALCKSAPCNVQTSVLPQHGIAYSATDAVTNSLLVLQQGAAYSGVATEAWIVTNAPAQTGLPRYNQSMYDLGTSGTTTASTYQLQLTVSNSGPNQTLNNALITFPSSYDANTNPPTIQSVMVNGANQTSSWRIRTQQNIGTLLTNQFVIQCVSGTCLPFNKTGVFTLSFSMFQIPFGYQSIAAKADYNGTSYTLSGNGSVTNAIVGATNIDSTELAVYSLDKTTMSATFTPAAIPLGPLTAATSTTLDFTNTSTASSAFPDYVDQLNLTVPQQIVPSSITVPSGWYVQQTSAGPPATYVIQVCPIGSAKPCSSTYEQNALAPGATLPINFNYASGADPGPAGMYNAQWTAVGANGGATTSPAENAPLQVTATSAQVAFTNVGGYVNPISPPASEPTPVPAGSQPQVGTDANYTGGSTFLYQITNNGQLPITSVAITVPGQTRAFTNGTDGAGMNWAFTTAPYVMGNGAASSGTCQGSLNPANYSNATTAGGNGSITLTGCNLATSDVLDIYFDAHAPYDVGSYFDWPALVTSSGTGSVSNFPAQPPYPAADSLQIALDAQLSVITPPSGTNTALSDPGPGGSTPVTSCLGCVVDATQSPPLITLGNFVGTFTATDLVNASVTSDAANPDGWILYASTNNNPLNGGGTPQLQTEGDAGHSSTVSGFTVSQTTFANIPVIATPSASNPGLQISTFSGSTHRQPIDTIMSYYVNSTGSTSAQSAVITYTLVLN